MSNKKIHQGLHPIQVAARRSGLSRDVIRVWERRYGAITPVRSGTNRRLYRNEDIQRLRLLAEVTEGGRRISDVAALATEELERMAREDREAGIRAPLPYAGSNAGQLAARHLSECIKAVSELDGQALESELRRAMVTLSPPNLMEQVMMPLMHLVGERWHTGSMQVAEEHMATPIVRAALWTLKQGQEVPANAPELLVATPAGQRHELGALMAAVAASAAGWQVTYLGADMPAQEIAAAALTRQARAIALSVTYPPDDPGLEQELLTLSEQVPVALLVGGTAAGSYRASIRRAGGLEVPTIARLQAELRRIRETGAGGVEVDHG